MGIVIDSSIFIAAERGKLNLDAQLALYQSEPLAIAAISASELFHGIHRAQTAQQGAARTAFVDSLLQRLRVVPFNLAIARIYAELWAKLAAAGTPIAAHDLMIAATAMALGYHIASHDLRSFPRTPGLNVLSW